MNEQHQETLEEFRASFFYGSRTDLLFKFLARLSPQEAGEVFRALLQRLGDAFDTGDYDSVLQHAYEWQVHAYTPKEDGPPPEFQYDAAPWSPLQKPLSHCRLALISAGGLFVKGDDPLGPNGPTQEEAISRISEFLRGPAVLSVIPRDVAPEELCIRHPGYDIRGTERDRNVVFPIDRLKELQAEGVIGGLAEENYSFVGATSQKMLLAEAAPSLAQQLRAREVDAALLVAA